MLLETLARIVEGIVRGGARGTAPTLTELEIQLAHRTTRTADDRGKTYALYQAYYDGQQRDPRKIAFGDVPEEVATEWYAARHNFCDVAIDAVCERLQVASVGVSAEGVAPERAAEIAGLMWRWWQFNRMDEHQITVHAQSMVKGDAYVMASWDEAAGVPAFHVYDALEIEPVYDGDHRQVAVYKSWTEFTTNANGAMMGQRTRINRYMAGRLDKFVSDNAGTTYRLYPDDIDPNTGEPDGGDVVWQDAEGRPLPIPVIHFPNKPRGRDMGRSDLADLIPFQDEYNRRIWNASQAGSYQGAPQRYGVGLLTTDEKGEPLPTEGGPGQMVLFRPANSGVPPIIGQWSAGDLNNLEDAADRQLRRLGSKARVPLHLIWPEGAGMPSGESLKTAEAGLIAKCTDRAVTLGNRWEDLIRLGLVLHNAFAAPEAAIPEADALTITINWRPFETRSALTDEQVLTLRAGDTSRAQRNRERGYTPEEITRIETEIETEGSAALAEVDRFTNNPIGGGAAV